MTQNFTIQSMGQAVIQINQVLDQDLHRDWIDLFDQSGNIIQGKLLIEFQWIYSSVRIKVFIFFSHEFLFSKNIMMNYKKKLKLKIKSYQSMMIWKVMKMILYVSINLSNVCFLYQVRILE